MRSDTKLSLTEDVQQRAEEYPFEIFLCGPSFESDKPSSILRSRLKDKLEEKGFVVVPGEDEGIKELQECLDVDAQSSEIEMDG